MQVAILGRQSKISLAELESIYSAANITPVDRYAAIIDTPDSLPQDQLGGTIKSAKLLTRLDRTDLEGAFRYLKQAIPEHLTFLPEGKLQFGVSTYGFRAQKNWLLRQMLELKKDIRKQGRSVRIIENKAEALETAQVLYNKLTSPLGWELLLIKDGSSVIVAQTTAVQDIDAYAARDFERPMRDAYVGMLPPKLAQIMINLARPKSRATILDPFCGTGVVLQEAMLMHHPVYGTDLSEKMVRYSRENLNWLQEKESRVSPWYLEVADATSHIWRQPIDTVVCETYLGKPLHSLPNQQLLMKVVDEADSIAERFLKNISPQLAPNTQLCVAFPAWHLGNGRFKHIKALDHLKDLGYNRLELVHATSAELVYHREDQVVARELTILKKI